MAIIAADGQRASSGATDHDIFRDLRWCGSQDDSVAIEDGVKGNRALGVSTAAKICIGIVGFNRLPQTSLESCIGLGAIFVIQGIHHQRCSGFPFTCQVVADRGIIRVIGGER